MRAHKRGLRRLWYRNFVSRRSVGNESLWQSLGYREILANRRRRSALRCKGVCFLRTTDERENKIQDHRPICRGRLGSLDN